MEPEQYAQISLKSVDEVLEDISLSRSRHTDLMNNMGIIKDALNEMVKMREQINLLREKLAEIQVK